MKQPLLVTAAVGMLLLLAAGIAKAALDIIVEAVSNG